MKKTALLCFSLAIGLTTALAAPPARRAFAPEGRKAPSAQVKADRPAHNMFMPKANPVNATSVKHLTKNTATRRLPERIPASKAPSMQRITQSGSSIYGMLVYDYNGEKIPGIYELDTDGSYKLVTEIPTTGCLDGNFEIGYFYVRLNQIAVHGQEVHNNVVYLGAETWLYNIHTGENGWIMHGLEPSYKLAAYDPVNDLLMGYYVIEGDWHLRYGTSPGDDPSKITEIADLGLETPLPMAALTYNVDTRKLVGVYGSGQGSKVVEIDPATADETDTGMIVANGSKYVTGLTYSPIDKQYYYAYCNEWWDYQGFDILDPVTFQPTFSLEYDRMIEWQNFACPDKQGFDGGAPDGTELIGFAFNGPALDGSVRYRLPSMTRDGVPVIGKIDWQLDIDGLQYKRGSAVAGSEIEIPLVMDEGMHSFNLRASIGGKEGRGCMVSRFIGSDTPAAPADVTLDGGEIRWTAVTTGANDGYVVAGDITYNVYLDGKLLKSGVKGTTCPSGLDTEGLLDNHFASVTAVFAGKESMPGYSYIETIGSYMEMPWRLEPEYERYSLFKVRDANGGSFIYYAPDIAFDEETVGGFFYEYDSDQDADEYLFMPATYFDDPDAVYDFGYSICRFGRYTETYEVVLATRTDSDDAIIKVLQPETLLDNTEVVRHTDFMRHNYFTVPEKGVYYVGIHVTSPADQYRVVMTDFSISKGEGMTVQSPDIPAGLSAEGLPDGELKARVSIPLPTKTISGATIPSSATLTATAQAAGCEARSVSGAPGQTVTVEIPTAQGNNTINVTVSDGSSKSAVATVDVYTGVDIPGAVTDLNIKTSADGMGFHLTWTAPEIGSNGGYIAQTGIKYYVGNPTDYGMQNITEIGTDVYSCDVKLAADAVQDIYKYAVFCENLAGVSEYYVECVGVAGLPINMPFTNNYKASETTGPVVVFDDRVDLNMCTPGWMWGQFETPDNPSALASMFMKWPDVVLTDARFSLPRVSTVGSKRATVSLETFGGCVKSFTVYAAAYGVDPEPVKTFPRSQFTESDIVTVDVELPAKFQNKEWIEIIIGFDTADDNDHMILYSWRYFDNVDNDFAVTGLDATSMAMVGKDAKFRANVENYGMKANPFPGATWRLESDGGELLAKVDLAPGDVPAAPGDVLSFPLTFTPNVEDMGEYTLTFTLNPGDENSTNNELVKKIKVVRGDAMVVTDLRAGEITSDKVSLEWSPNEVGGGVRTESFEDLTAFVTDSEADDEMLGAFRRIDGDGKPTDGPASSGYVKVPSAFKPASFVVWSQAEMKEFIGDESFYTNHGDKFITAMCPTYNVLGTPAADDWLISPSVEGGSEISFSVRPISVNYGPETLEVMYSTGGNEPSDFKLLERLEVTGGGENPTVWEDFSFTLPADAKHFALHYVSCNVFGIFIDNIAYSPLYSDLELYGYDIYRDGSMIDWAVKCTDGNYDDTTVAPESGYVYSIVPVLSDGTRGLMSNSVLVRTAGIGGLEAGERSVYVRAGEIVVRGYDGCAVSVAGADGRIYGEASGASATETFAVNAGIYIVKAGGDIVKVIVN